ncbi:MAG: xanthine/uracil/vitamin C permease [Deltaproteobacteria bacterium]|nr:xanthine/uracil/vitamin C permease [Deltaproteobacteria bacterium]
MSEPESPAGRAGGLRLFSRDDLGAFWALFADNLANLIIVMGVCSFVFKMPAEVVFGRILPGLGVALVVGLSAYAYLAHRLARREGRSDVTALPYGISTPILFVYLFGIIGPVYWKSGDALLAWRVGLAAAFIGGLIEAAGSIAGPWLKRVLPRAGMLGTLAGIALTFIAAVPLAEIFEHPLIGLPCLAVILVGLVALVRLPLGVPAGLAAIVLGVAIGLGTGEASFSAEGIGFYPPVPVLGDLWAGLGALWEHSWIFGVVIPAEIYNFIETMNNVESAEAAGDAYPVRSCQVIDGLGTILGSLFGSAFPTTVYIGHPGYKRMGGRAGYALGVGGVLLLAAVFGLLSVLRGLVPVAAVAPILVFIGLVITAQAFQACPRPHAMAVTLAMLPHLSSLLVTKWGSLHQALGELLGPERAQGLPGLCDPALLAAMLGKGAHVAGHTALAGGSILVGMLWGAAAAFIIDRAWYRAALVMGTCALLALFGVVHAPSLGLYPVNLVWTYAGLAACLAALGPFGARLKRIGGHD